MIIERKICFFFRRILYGWQLAWLFDIESGESGMVNAALTAINWTASTCLIFNQRPHTKRMIHYHRHRTQSSSPEWKMKREKSLSNFSGAITSSFDTFFEATFPVSRGIYAAVLVLKTFHLKGQYSISSGSLLREGWNSISRPEPTVMELFFCFRQPRHPVSSSRESSFESTPEVKKKRVVVVGTKSL